MVSKDDNDDDKIVPFYIASGEINLTCPHKVVSQRLFNVTYEGFLRWTSVPLMVFFNLATSSHIAY